MPWILCGHVINVFSRWGRALREGVGHMDTWLPFLPIFESEKCLMKREKLIVKR